jgi:hypothetical protein
MTNWRYTLHIKDAFVDNADELNEEQVIALAQTLTGRLKAFVSKLSANADLRYEIEDVAWEMSNCTTVEEIDEALYLMYDVCDANRVWVK